ncbi:class V lanthionine synthetase subunit LxmK [Actinoallomurus soli]|uniref:class V lanthionine synthetase subunit LxmK n=1 Tax=Actinoallomurus soli TaxID=2952535 RepID=UPI0020930115|nr:class V lanthionine synthetase subunit LxmK [Actinoallomurus soli]MCO5971633.1 class V lanthionine synthetase subunit LxmK [Actinoallomurus soli]
MKPLLAGNAVRNGETSVEPLAQPSPEPRAERPEPGTAAPGAAGTARTPDRAIDTGRLPEVNEVLGRLGLGRLTPENARAFPGRNDNWSGRTTSGEQVFVKRIDGQAESAARRLHRLIAFERGNPGLPAPRCLGWDEAARLVVFELIPDARTGNDLAADEAFDDALAHRAGRVVGRLHSAWSDPEDLDDSPPDLPPVPWLHALPDAVFTASSAAALEVWRLLQGDDELIAALTRMREKETAAVRTATHCDLRLDQFLLSASELYLTDWEEFRLADPARDIGGFAGEWLYRAITAIPESARSDSGSDAPLTHRQILSAGAREIERRRPLIAAFWSGHRAERGAIDAGLAERSAAFAGWHLLDRVLSLAEHTPRIRAVDRAAFGIGRRVLLNAADAATTLGLGDLS